MKFSALNECTLAITDQDVVLAMKKIPGYLDITPSDFMEVYQAAFFLALSRIKNAIKADQIMTRKVIAVHEGTSLLEVVKKMAVHGISGLPVLKSDQTISGVISGKDVLKQMQGEAFPSFMGVLLKCLENRGCLALDIQKRVASDIMSSPPIVVHGKTPILEVANTMDQFAINRVPVIDDENKPVGIIARSDLVKAMG